MCQLSKFSSQCKLNESCETLASDYIKKWAQCAIALRTEVLLQNLKKKKKNNNRSIPHSFQPSWITIHDQSDIPYLKTKNCVKNAFPHLNDMSYSMGQHAHYSLNQTSQIKACGATTRPHWSQASRIWDKWISMTFKNTVLGHELYTQVPISSYWNYIKSKLHKSGMFTMVICKYLHCI